MLERARLGLEKAKKGLARVRKGLESGLWGLARAIHGLGRTRALETAIRRLHMWTVRVRYNSTELNRC